MHRKIPVLEFLLHKVIGLHQKETPDRRLTPDV